MAKKYYWLKLKADFFTSRAMKKLRRIAGGDTYTIIYLKLQLLSLKDEGALYYEGVEPTFYEEMALALDEDAENVRATLLFLENMGLIERKNDHEYILTQVPYLLGSETDKAELMRKKRERDKLLNGNNVTDALPPVTKRYTEIEKDIELDIDIEKEKDIELEKSKSKKKAQAPYFEDEELNEAFKDFIEMRKKIRKPMTDKAISLAISKLNKLSNNETNKAIAILNQSIESSWTGLYPLHDDKKPAQNHTNQAAQELDDFYNMASAWAESEGTE